MDERPVRIREVLRGLKGRQKEMVRLLGRFVRCESPSHNKAAVDRFGRMIAREWRRRGAMVSILRQTVRGNHVRAEVSPGMDRPVNQILVLGHLDTVYSLGTLKRMPFRVAGGRAWGPGAFDMKAGHVLALLALDVLRAGRVSIHKRVVFLWTSDEEIGSGTSRKVVEREARRSDVVLVLEPAFGRDGRLKTARKGVGGAEVIVAGKAAHAGIDPRKGVNAVHELALQISRLMKWNRPRRGTTVQATVVEGGSVSNVVPSRASAQLDIRFARAADERTLRRKLRSLRPILKGAGVEVRLAPFRPPLERTAAVGALFRQAQLLAREMGLALGEAATGGGSDGNFTAALGIATLDGLGAVGDGAHSPGEHVLVRALPERAALLAGLLATL